MTHVLSEMTWPEIERRLAETRLVVVPTASVEQHGPHLPLSVDSLRAEVLGRRIAEALDCVCAPVVRPGLSAHHMGFPGTITLDEETFRGVVRSYCESLATHGFADIAFFTSHGGNATVLADAASTLDDDLEANVFVAGTRSGLMEVREATMAEFGVSPEQSGAHAGAAETAFILETHPEFVVRDEREAGFVGDLADVSLADGVRAVSENGVLGDPRPATVEQGARLVDACVEYFAAEIERARSVEDS